MSNKFVTAVFVAFLLVAPGVATAATTTAAPQKATVVVKKPVVKAPVKKAVVKKPVKAATCVRCPSLAEGTDKSKASKAAMWVGTVIGMNAGSHDVIITEATALNRIKAYPQRNISIDANTKIITTEGDEKTFNDMDIGYRVEVKGTYDAKKRTIKASSIEITKVPEVPVTKTK